MNKFTRYMQNYLLYGFPFMAALIIWSALSPQASINPNGNFFIKYLHEGLSFNLMFWFLTLVVYMFLLVIIPGIRDKTLRRLANLQERDEREEFITGKAARAAYIASLSLLLFFLFFSLFTFKYSELSKPDANSPKHSVSIGVHYSFFNPSKINETTSTNMKTIFDSNEFALSNTTLILILLGWQLMVFNFAARRER